MQGKDTLVLHGVEYTRCDVDAQCGISNIVGIGTTAFFKKNPYHANCNIMLKRAVITPPVRDTQNVNTQSSLSFSSRRLQPNHRYYDKLDLHSLNTNDLVFFFSSSTWARFGEEEKKYLIESDEISLKYTEP